MSNRQPVLVHQALDGSPGVRRVAAFGPRLGRPARLSGESRNTVVDDGWTSRYPAVEIYAVGGAHRAVVASGSPLVVGGPEDLLGLTEAGLLGDEPAVLAVDAPGDLDPDGLILTDGLRRREANFARIQNGRSATLEGGDDGRRGAPAREYVLGDARWETQARILGAESVSASSSRAFADTPGPVLPETLPFAAFDGLLDTAWESGPPEGARPWVGIRFASPTSVPSVVVVVAGESDDEDAPARVRVVTDGGSSRSYPALPGQPVTIELADGRTSELKVVRDGAPGPEFKVAEVQLPGVDVDRTLELPRVPARWGPPDSILLSSTAGWREACVNVGDDVRCGVGRGRIGEEPGALDRTIRLGTGAAYAVSAMAVPVDGEALQGLIQRDQLVNVRASSAAVDDARGSAVAAIDGDPGTTWVADPDDERPTLSVSWLVERKVRSVRVLLDQQVAASRATRLELAYPGGRQLVELDGTGRARVEPFSTTRLDVRLLGLRRTTNLLADGTREPGGAGVSELSLDGTGLLPITLSDTPVDIGCAFGPTLRVGGALFPTTVTASPRDLFSGGMLPATVCGPPRIDVPAQPTRVVLAPAPAFRGVRVVMQSRAAPRPVVTPATLTGESPVERELGVPSADAVAIAAVRENQNEGWEASVPGVGSATGVTVDGWQQGWRLDGPVEKVRLSFAPDRLYRSSLAVGGVLIALLAAAAWVLRRRSGSRTPLGSRSIHPLVMVTGGLLALGAMAGSVALACGAAAVGAVAVLGRRAPADLVSWASGVLVAVAAVFYWLRPLGSADGWAGSLTAPQLFVAAAVGLLLSADLVPLPTRRSLRRMAGRSTSR